MAGEFCVYIPTIRRKKSVLYQDLYNYTGKDHALTNFLYAISLSDEMRSKFSKSEFNSQGEISFKAYKEKGHLEDILSAKLRLVDERRNIGAIDASGNEIGYDSPNEIKDRVINYNDSHEQYHAKINYKEGKYYIDLDVTDASNYKTNTILKELDARFNAFETYVRSKGISTNWSNEAVNKYFNFRNYRTLKGIITGFFDLADPFANMGSTKIEVLMELLSHATSTNVLLERIRGRFADDTGEAIKKVSTGEKLNIPDADYWEGMINNLFEAARRLFSPMDMDDLDNAEDEAVDGLSDSGESFLEVPLVTIDEIMEDLDDRFHIKQELITDTGNNIQSLSEAAKKFMTLLRRRYAELRDIKHSTDRVRLARFNKRINALQRLIDSGDYISSISSFLTTVFSEFNGLKEDLEAIRTELNENPTNELETLNYWSSVINECLSFVKAYSSVVKDVSNINLLEIDQEVPKELITDVKTTATLLNSTINEVDKLSRIMQFDVVYLFLQKYWGQDDIKIVDGKAVSLRDLLRTLSSDVNLVEHLFFSMNESTDEALGLFYEAVKTQNRKRDADIRKVEFIIRTATDELHRAGGNFENLFIRDADGKVYRYMRSEVDYAKYFEDKKAYRQQKREEGLRGERLVEAMRKWEDDHLKQRSPFENEDNNKEYIQYMQEFLKEIYDMEFSEDEILDNYAPVSISMPNDDYRIADPKNMGLNAAERKYYLKMIALRTIVTNGIFNSSEDLFKVIPIEATVSENPVDKLKRAAELFASAKVSEDDDLFGDTFEDMLAGNNLRTASVTLEGMEYMQLPLFFKHGLEKDAVISTDFSRAMLTLAGASLNYLYMSDAIDALTLAQEYLTTARGFNKPSGPFSLINVIRQGKETRAAPIQEDVARSRSASQVTKFSLSNIYNQRKDATSEVELFGQRVSVNDAVDTLTGVTSVLGLSVNLLGAEANVLVGEIQMFIESVAKEFFTIRNWAVGDLHYTELLPEYLGELGSYNKKSKLALLGDFFNVMEDYYETLRQNGFSKSLIGRILSNPELMFLYGAGEHLLHNQTMLAILDAVKVWDTQTSTEVPLYDIFSVRVNGNNGTLEQNRDRYKWIERNEAGEIDHTREITDDDIVGVEKQITYCNKSMHGAFGAIDRGTAHRNAIWRLFLNFRQWMPAHYARRFNTLHYDADLGEYRRGFYSSTFTFLGNAIAGLYKGRTTLAGAWDSLSEMDKFNIRRTIAEVGMLLALSVSMIPMGTYKDKKGNWAYRNLMYQMRRMMMEVQASTPFFIPFLTDPMGFVNNIMTILNSPFAALNTIETIADTFNLLDLFDTIEGGKYDGENRWMHNLKKNAPFVGQISKQYHLKDRDDLFHVFEKHM